MPVSSRAAQVFDRLRSLHGGTAVTHAQARLTAANTKSISADDCVQVDVQRGAADGSAQDRCAFLVRASAYTSGFSVENPVTPRAGDLVTVSGETVAWTVQAASVRGAGAYYRLDATRDRAAW